MEVRGIQASLLWPTEAHGARVSHSPPLRASHPEFGRAFFLFPNGQVFLSSLMLSQPTNVYSALSWSWDSIIQYGCRQESTHREERPGSL